MRAARAADQAADRPSVARARAARTATAVAAVDPEWALPWWLDRQSRPNHPAFVPLGESGLVDNVTGRSWVVLATTSSGPLALVDPAGSLHPIGSSWSLDWAIGAEDRWHRPAPEPTVRQRLVSQAPVVETACKVPGGDAIARVYAVATGGVDGDAVVFEIENESPVPFVAVLMVRPTHPLGVGSVASIRYEHPHVFVDERPTVLFDKRAARWSTADAPHDALIEATEGRARDDTFVTVRSASGLATASFLVPVPHRATVRALLFPQVARRARPVSPTTVPSAGQVARGWEAHTAGAARIELPDRRVTDAYLAALSGLLAATSGGFPAPVGRETAWAVADETAIVATLASVGMHDAVCRLLRHRGDEVELDSWFRREPASIERNIAIFDAVGAHWWATRDPTVVVDLLGAVVKAAHWTERARSRRASRIGPHLARRAARALSAVAAALRAAEQPEAADDLDAFAARFVLDLDDTERSPTFAADTELVSISTQARRGDGERPVAIATRTGLDPSATAHVACAELAARDAFAFERLTWLVRAGGPVTRWPTRVHPRLLTGSAGSGDDPLVAAAFVALVRALVVDEDTHANTLVLLPVVPATWYGQSVDVHDLPTRVGVLSFAVRWHATRPALLWELTPYPGTGPNAFPVTITAPGLDPSWSTTVTQGEVLLDVPPLGTQVTVTAHADTDHVPMTTLEPRLRREAADDRPVVSADREDASLVEPGDSFG